MIYVKFSELIYIEYFWNILIHTHKNYHAYKVNEKVI